MGKARGIMRLSGKMDNVVFYEREGNQYFRKYDPTQAERMKNLPSTDGRKISSIYRTGTLYYAKGIWDMMKNTGMNFSKAEWNNFWNHLHESIARKMNYTDAIKASTAKLALQGYKYGRDPKSRDIYCKLEGNTLTIENSSPFSDRWKPEEGFAFQICRETFDDVPFKKGKYSQANIEVTPADMNGLFTTTIEDRKVVIEIEPLAANEIMVLGVYPTVDGHYPTRKGASLWVF